MAGEVTTAERAGACMTPVVQSDKSKLAAFRKEVRQALADYIYSEGCDCCRGPEHDEHGARLAKLLRVQQYADSSGFDWPKHRSKK